jgi:hypothetical protein
MTRCFKKLPPKARRRCPEYIAVRRRGRVYVEKCGKRASFSYGGMPPWAVRCTGHKEHIERIAEEGAKMVDRILSKCTELA